ncbi:MAG: hypothetical protein V4604_05635 [Bacteroidota bacterium]
MKYISILFFGALLLSSCVRNNPKPVWLTLDKWVLEANPTQVDDAGQLTQNLSEVWVYVDNKIIGVFELPCKIPVLASGENVKIQLYPAVRNNGIAATKKIYPFVEPVELTMKLVEGETYVMPMTTRYYSNVKFWIEDFESPSQVKLETDDISTTDLTLDDDPAIALPGGGSYGQVHFTTSDSLWVAYTTENQILPQSGAEVYLEIDYRNSNSLLTGVLGISSSDIKQNPNIALNGQDPSTMVWKKIYIDLKEIVSNSTSAEYFKQYFRALIDEGDSQSDIYIDNIKVVHF